MSESLQLAIKRGVYTLIAFFVIIIIFVFIQIVKESGSFDNFYNTITVEGDAEIFAAPDIATISFSARAENASLETAQIEIEEVVSSIISGLEKLDIDEKDIKTTYYNAYPRYEYNRKCIGYNCDGGERELVGYEVNQTVSIKIRDLENVSGVLSTLGNAKVSDLNGPNFSIENRDELVQEAREEAIKEAKERAKDLAKELGVKLKGISSYNDGSSNVFYKGGIAEPSIMTLDSAEFAVEESFEPTIPEGENRIYQSVSITYRIK